jgi:hypothetical protein
MPPLPLPLGSVNVYVPPEVTVVEPPPPPPSPPPPPDDDPEPVFAGVVTVYVFVTSDEPGFEA